MEVILQSMLVILIVIAMVAYYFILPKKDPINISEIPESYVIQTSNKIELQKHYECAAFASAYVLRHFGIEADGDRLYKKFPGKLLDGTVSPKGITLFFRNLDYKVSYYYGNVDTLKQQLSRVILFIRVLPEQCYLHLVPVVGYDEEYVYLADSLSHTMNSNEAHYNRKILIRELEVLWRTWVPFCKNSYIVIRPKQIEDDRRSG